MKLECIEQTLIQLAGEVILPPQQAIENHENLMFV